MPRSTTVDAHTGMEYSVAHATEIIHGSTQTIASQRLIINISYCTCAVTGMHKLLLNITSMLPQTIKF